MALDLYQQSYNLIENSKNILIVGGKREVGDVYPSGIALKKILTAAGKNTTFFMPWDIPHTLDFLQKDTGDLQKTIHSTREIIITIDTLQKPIKQISYERNTSSLNIYVHPEETIQISEQDIHVSVPRLMYDLIVTVGLEDLASLGEHFERNAQFFYETPVINLDRSISNERYGEVNLVEPLASSCSEIVTTLIKKWGETLLNENITTALLAGIISATNNFQSARTKPNTLYEAAYLMSKEANQQEIIKHLFKTKAFEVIKLCGIAMSKFHYGKDTRFGWATITQQDFVEANTDEMALPTVISELRNSLMPSHSLLIFFENNEGMRGVASVAHEEKTAKLIEYFKGTREGNNVVFDIASKDNAELEKIALETSRIINESAL